MKKRVAVGIAGASAVLIAGWRVVQQMTEREEFPLDPMAAAPGMTAEPSKKAEAESSSRVTPKPAAGAPSPKASKAELYEIARDLDIEGRSKMSKAELIKAIEAAG